MDRSRALAGLALALWLITGCQQAQIFQGPGVWLGECEPGPCGWERLSGSLARTATWSEQDYAYELLEPGTRIAQRGSASWGCLGFLIVGDIEASARLELQIDFNDDGRVDQVLPVPPSHWEQQELAAYGPAPSAGMRTFLEKRGDGRAAIARLEVQTRVCTDDSSQLKLVDGSVCERDAQCASARCPGGLCARCPANGCGEGDACRDDSECATGGCAGGVCRACARVGSCAPDVPCTTATQCASGSCVAGSLPLLIRFPGQDRACGECASDAACASGKCVAGRCSACANDADCGASGLECRYSDLYEAHTRSCVPARAPQQLPRGALCERESDCAGGLSCGAPPGRAKRCGVACTTHDDCDAASECAAGGALAAAPGDLPRTLPGWSDSLQRIATCYAKSASGLCEVHGQCMNSGCCRGNCYGSFDLLSGTCLSDGPWL